MIEQIAAYKTSDGSVFENAGAAQAHENILEARVEYEADPIGEVYHYVPFSDFVRYIILHHKVAKAVLKLEVK